MKVLLVDRPERRKRKRGLTVHEDGAVQFAEALKEERRFSRKARVAIESDTIRTSNL